MQTKRLKLTQLEPNLGQIEGLPINPRQWTQGDVDKIAKSLNETPELFEARPLLVIEHEGKYVILGGNLRYEGCKKNAVEDAPCYVFPKDTPIDKLKEIVVKDNGSFGAWDMDALANEWDDLPLSDWGVPVWDVRNAKEFAGENKEIELDEGDDNMVLKLNFKFDEYQFVNSALLKIDESKEKAILKMLGYGDE